MPNISQEDRDKSSPVWDMSQERVLMITLINQRFQFFVIFVSIVVAGSLNARVQQHMTMILAFGAVVGWAIAISLSRTQRRLETIVAVIRKDETHPLTITMKALGRRQRRIHIISHIVPFFCCVVITIGAILSAIGVLAVAPRG